MRESAESRTLVPDEAPPLPPLGLRVAAREIIEAERVSPRRHRRRRWEAGRGARRARPAPG